MEILDDTCVYHPQFDIFIDPPMILGKENDVAYEIDCHSFLRLFTFLNLYWSQSFLVALNHFSFKTRSSSLKEYVCHARFNFNMVSKDDRMAKVMPWSSIPILGCFEADKYYSKFFVGWAKSWYGFSLNPQPQDSQGD
jgi:hypothetical protein